MQLDGFRQISEGDFKTDPYENVTLDQFLAGDYELTPSPETEIRVVIVEPLKPPRESVIPNTLEDPLFEVDQEIADVFADYRRLMHAQAEQQR